MTEWWTYRPSDFLMFSPRVYARLIERVNESSWPLPLLGMAAGFVLLALLWRRDRWGLPLALRLLAFGWGAVALLFHARHFATINTAAPVFAWAFGLQALVWLGLARAFAHRLDAAGPQGHEATGPAGPDVAWQPAGNPWRVGALVLGALAALYPLLPAALDLPWQRAETFGLLPDPTVLATLAVRLAMRLPRLRAQALRMGLRLLVWTVPLAWCGIALGLQWTLREAGG